MRIEKSEKFFRKEIVFIRTNHYQRGYHQAVLLYKQKPKMFSKHLCVTLCSNCAIHRAYKILQSNRLKIFN